MTLKNLSPDISYTKKFNFKDNNISLFGSKLMLLKQSSKSSELSRKFGAGDKISMIDWKLFARSDQLQVRETHKENSINCCIVVDFNDSMFWPTQDILDDYSLQTKFELSLRILLNLAYAHMSIGNSVKFMVVNEKELSNTIFSFKMLSQVLILFEELNASNFTVENFTDNIANLSCELEGIKNYDLIYFLSDGLKLDTMDLDLKQLTAHSSKIKHKFFHVFSSLELDHSWIKSTSLYCSKTNNTTKHSGNNLLQNSFLLNEINNWINNTRQIMHQIGFDCFTVSESTSKEDYLNYILL